MPLNLEPLPLDGPVGRNFQQLQDELQVLTGLAVFVGSGSPNGAVIASPPALYFNRAGGAGVTIYVKESGMNTNTGWVGK